MEIIKMIKPNFQIITFLQGCILDTLFFDTEKEVEEKEKDLRASGYILYSELIGDEELNYVVYDYRSE
tara:strand:- start:1755 stop:1958 length:204 start_codon:yes stop_codon:yes gene_type:complete